MKECQNPNCRAKIERETAIYCPYCGQFQRPTGWHYDEQRYNIESMNDLIKLDPDNFLPPKIVKLPNEIKQILIDGNVLVTLQTSMIIAYDIVPMLYSQSSHVLWEVRIKEPVKLVILRPYLFIIDLNYIIAIHLVTGVKTEILNFTTSHDYSKFRNPDILLPVESLIANKRYPLLLILKQKDLMVIALDDKKQAHVSKTVIKAEHGIIAMQIADDNSTKIKFCTGIGEIGEFSTTTLLTEQTESRVISPNNHLFNQENKPSGGFRVEWYFLRGGNTYFYIRKNDGSTEFYIHDHQNTRLLEKNKTFAIGKKPCYGKIQPRFLFELRDQKNKLTIYSLDDNTWNDIYLDPFLYLGINDNDFEFYPNRVLYLNNSYWTICETDKEENIPYKLVNFMAEENAIESNLIIEKWNIADNRITSPGRKKVNLPLLWNYDMLISYITDRIILFKTKSE